MNQVNDNGDPVMLYNDPHPVHRAMAEAVDAELVEASQGSVIDRFRSAAGRKYDRPIILEGGVPLVEAAFAKLLRQAKAPVILLAADETQQNIHEGLDYYSAAETKAHRVAHRFIDGAIAVSESVAEYTRPLINGPIAVAEPFILDGKYEQLKELRPGLNNDRILTVGENRPGNGHDILRTARGRIEESAYPDVEFHFVGKGTDGVSNATPNVHGHGFVSDEELLEQYEKADLFVHAARAGANPVVAMEAMRAGVPVLTTYRTATADVIKTFAPALVRECSPESIADGIKWYLDRETGKRQAVASYLEVHSQRYSPDKGVLRFRQAYQKVVNEA